MITTLTVSSLAGETHINVSLLDGRVWVKQYLFFRAATGEAEDLGAILPFKKELLDASLPGPNYPQGFTAEADVDVAYLMRRGFRLEKNKS